MMLEHPLAVAGRSSSGKSFELCSSLELDSVSYAASLTKQFIGLLISQLVHARQVDEKTQVRELLPELPRWAGDIELQHLLHHTSGIPSMDDVLTQLGLPKGVDGEQQLDNELVIRALMECSLHRKPGDAFEYSNVGYICLAEIVQRVCGASIAEVAHTRLFEPLGMLKSHLGNRAIDTRDFVPPSTIGDGGLWSTASDLCKWNTAMNERTFGLSVHLSAESPGVLNNGTPLDYAWGVRRIVENKSCYFSHGGTWPGISSKMMRSVERGTSVVILTSSEDAVTITRAARHILDWASF